MNNLELGVTKRIILLSSFFGTFLLLTSVYCWKIGLCSLLSYDMAQGVDEFAPSLFIFLPLLFFSLVTYNLRQEVFSSWKNLVIFWVPLSILLVSVASPEGGNVFPFPSLKGIIALFSFFAFILISTIIILTKSYTTKVKK